LSQHRKHRGYASQRIVADFLRLNGYPYAESTGAGRTGSDITGVPFDVEVKARRGFDPKAALSQLSRRAGSSLAFAVLRLNGQGKESVGDWAVVMRFTVLLELIKGREEWVKIQQSQK
jgi:hypothetical protein